MKDWEALAAKLRAAEEGHLRALERVDMAERALAEAKIILHNASERKSFARGDLYRAALEPRPGGIRHAPGCMHSRGCVPGCENYDPKFDDGV